MINVDAIQATNAYIIHPVWDKFKTESGLLLGEEMYEHTEQMPVHLFPTKGEVISSPIPHGPSKHDTIYFTWNGVSFNRCVSPIEDQNIFALNQAWFAYESDGILYSFDDFCLLSLVYDERVYSEGGLFIGDMNVIGNGNNYRVGQRSAKKARVGKVAALPKGYNDIVCIGDILHVIQDSDVEVTIDDEVYYRVRFSEILYRENE